jgi:hypothetical protein
MKASIRAYLMRIFQIETSATGIIYPHNMGEIMQKNKRRSRRTLTPLIQSNKI